MTYGDLALVVIGFALSFGLGVFVGFVLARYTRLAARGDVSSVEDQQVRSSMEYYDREGL